MDEIVEAALKKWPNVPHCWGWLGLDARGDWYLRDEPTQAAGPFPRSRGSRVEHAALRRFIQRNYERDEAGAWFFQNGPQRVYVELEAAPWIWRLQPPAPGAVEPRLVSHTGRDGRFAGAWLDQHGRLFVDSDIGFGLVHSLDIELASGAVEHGRWTVNELAFEAMPARFGYRLSPAAGR